ncbi:DUF3558 domain-containing protein [Lentzea aerocolonigenes]|uniref:DUF3558 domain-containing protein n=1 Tax=Lentzea aerocolonigenes TaxID=68170 RepID=UPI0004C4598C|nr:DUF3558 domain-containing protein [Lentzea aerocolonigenes]MCP2246463.1 Protein of unknown function (DUF3558) [Lentzea aerocolonigenes]
MTALLATVFAFGALAGCTSSQTGGNPTTPPATGGQTTTSEPTSGGPGLSIAKYVSAPCSVLKPDQVATLGTLRATTPGTGVLGPNCTYQGKDVIKNSTYVVTVTEGQDFEDAVNNVKDTPNFTDKKIDGVRVVSYDRGGGELACATVVQASKTDSVMVQVSTAADERTAKKPCPESERVAQLIITNLKG